LRSDIQRLHLILYFTFSTKVSPVFKLSCRSRIISVVFPLPFDLCATASDSSTFFSSPFFLASTLFHHRSCRRARFARHHPESVYRANHYYDGQYRRCICIRCECRPNLENHVRIVPFCTSTYDLLRPTLSLLRKSFTIRMSHLPVSFLVFKFFRSSFHLLIVFSSVK